MQRAKKYTLEQVAALLPWPDDLANKYSRGKLTLIAGCADYPGAACLAAVASQRMGAGYTEVACFRPNPSRRCARQARRLWCARGTSWRRTRSLILMNGGSIAGSPAAVQAAPASSDGRAGAYRACRSGRPVHAAPRPKALGPVAPRHPLAFLVGSGFDAADPLSAQLTCTVLEGAAAAVLVDGGGLDALTSPEGRLLLRRRFIDGLPTVITPHAGGLRALPLRWPCLPTTRRSWRCCFRKLMA